MIVRASVVLSFLGSFHVVGKSLVRCGKLLASVKSVAFILS